MARRAIAAVGLVLAALVTTGCEDEFKADCKAQGGVIDESTATGTGVGYGVGANGKGGTVVTTTTTTTRYCIVDGKIAAVE